MPLRCPILRCYPPEENDDDDRLPNLSDDILALIVSKISPTQFEPTSDYVLRFVNHGHVWHSGDLLSPSHVRLLKLLMTRYFVYLENLTTPIALFYQVLIILVKTEPDHSNLAMPHLRNLTLQIGEEYGTLYLVCFGNLNVCRKVCKRLTEVNLHVKISDFKTCFFDDFTLLIRYLLQITDAQTIWNLTLEDCSVVEEGAHDLESSVAKLFPYIAVTMVNLSVTPNRFTLIDRQKISRDASVPTFVEDIIIL
ncbi:hypothetical protein KIN20_030840 [Parelaphostrongylus tenuis]|uniref:Uncharacterized protein n=1 Tax=Parelaphostrongylus tenuis TaxID=148309 RepID=A0AAD5WH65_PARTN|nr:hypothetical protein KIN20_030840 [Parelaphostrongylus tenuis]